MQGQVREGAKPSEESRRISARHSGTNIEDPQSCTAQPFQNRSWQTFKWDPELNPNKTLEPRAHPESEDP